MKKYRITYLPFAQSTLEASDVIVTAVSETNAQEEFERRYPAWAFVKAEEVL